jgi:hypothetical protein
MIDGIILSVLRLPDDSARITSVDSFGEEPAHV